MRELALRDRKRSFDLWQRMRHDLLVGGNPELGKHEPVMGHVVDHVGVGVDPADPLIHARPLAYVLRRQTRPAKRLIYIRGDGAGLVDGTWSLTSSRATRV